MEKKRIYAEKIFNLKKNKDELFETEIERIENQMMKKTSREFHCIEALKNRYNKIVILFVIYRKED